MKAKKNHYDCGFAHVPGTLCQLSQVYSMFTSTQSEKFFILKLDMQPYASSRVLHRLELPL